MIDALSYRGRMWRLEHDRRKVSRAYDKERRKAKKAGATLEALEDLFHQEYALDADLIEEELMLLRSRRLIQSASKLFIPVPDYMDSLIPGHHSTSWVNGKASGRMYLSMAAQRKLDAEIRTEKAARSEPWRQWITLWIAGLTGLIGTATGLAALLHRGGH